MKLFNVTAVSLAVLLTLTACGGDKPAETKQEAKTETAPEAKAETTTQASAGFDWDNSPTIKMTADNLKLGTWVLIHASSNMTTDEQLNCVLNPDKALFLEAAKSEMKDVGEEWIKKSDEFYATEVGQRVQKFVEQSALQAQAQAQGKPFEGELVTLSEEDQAKMVEFGQSEAAKKIGEASNKDPAAIQAILQGLADKEKARCKLS